MSPSPQQHQHLTQAAPPAPAYVHQQSPQHMVPAPVPFLQGFSHDVIIHFLFVLFFQAINWIKSSFYDKILFNFVNVFSKFAKQKQGQTHPQHAFVQQQMGPGMVPVMIGTANSPQIIGYVNVPNLNAFNIDTNLNSSPVNSQNLSPASAAQTAMQYQHHIMPVATPNERGYCLDDGPNKKLKLSSEFIAINQHHRF